ncbi:ANTAR domain-containing protein [Streptomyces sp. STR69]|uniref:ANTAR domain-containing protein n=1 Tax=Streptomyces sp. STR69 TaxID=1796942 RepID=UPI0021C74F7F|nr:ANTAR domain-containing protein [Streptomyces sp. STR69]
MRRTTAVPRGWWDLRAETAAGKPAEQDAVAPRAEADQLRLAPAAGAVVDQACGMVMVLVPCHRGPARNLLVDVSRQCNTDVPDVASALVATWEGEPFPVLMQRALRHALRRFYAEDRGCDSRPTGETSGSRPAM